MIKKCYILNGEIINIGEWDSQKQPVEINSAEYDEEGNILKEAVFEDKEINPLPEGVIEEERDFEYDADRGWYEVGTEAPKTPQQQIEELKQLVADLASLQLGV